MTKAELEARVAELEAELAALRAEKKNGKTETEKDSFGCRAGTKGFVINQAIAGLIARGRKLNPNLIYQMIGGEEVSGISLHRVKQQIPYLKGKGLI